MDAETIKLKGSRQQVDAADANMSGSSFNDVNLSDATFNDVNLAGATIDNVNMSGCHMRNVNLSGLQISGANLTDASIVESVTDGMTIDGIAVSELLAAYRARGQSPN
jgi:uncharacterized protein YjbI with pentapeptide repeats